VTLFRLAARNVARNTRRSALTLGGVAVGFAAIAMAGGFVAQSFQALREGTIRGGTGHLQIADAAAFDGGPDASRDHPVVQAARVEALVAADPEVAVVLPRIEFVALVSSGSRSFPCVGTGVDPAGEARAMDAASSVVRGRWLADGGERGVVLGAGLAKALGVSPGDVVGMLSGTPERGLHSVRAVVAGIAALPFQELDDRAVFTTVDLAGELLAAPGEVSKLAVVLKDRADPAVVLERLLGTLRAAGLPLAGRTWRELAHFYRQVRLLYIGIFGFMGAVIVVVVLLAAANTMMMAASERTREVGTLRALGTRASRVRNLLVAEGLLIGIAGSAAGAALALLLRFVLNHAGIMLPPPPGVARPVPLHIQLFPLAYVVGAGVMTATLAAAAYVPARRAARRPIVEALAHV
jgi:putative ABC transport system permease protein